MLQKKVLATERGEAMLPTALLGDIEWHPASPAVAADLAAFPSCIREKKIC